MPTTYSAAIAALCAALIIAAGAFMFTPVRRRERALRRTLKHIGHDTLHNLIVPDGVEGEIHIDTVLLTERGLLVLEIKRVDGKVFGGNRVDLWTAIGKKARVQFANPLALLNQRVIALRSLFKDTPVEGRVVFVGDVTLSGDLPEGVTDVPGLRDEFVPDRSGGPAGRSDAWHNQWNELRRSSAA